MVGHDTHTHHAHIQRFDGHNERPHSRTCRCAFALAPFALNTKSPTAHTRANTERMSGRSTTRAQYVNRPEMHAECKMALLLAFWWRVCHSKRIIRPFVWTRIVWQTRARRELNSRSNAKRRRTFRWKQHVQHRRRCSVTPPPPLCVCVCVFYVFLSCDKTHENMAMKCEPTH